MNEGSEIPGREGAGEVPRHIVVFTVVTAVLSTVAFVLLLLMLPHASVGIGESDAAAIVEVLVFTSILMLASGALGGCLYNFRGLVKHSQDNDFNPHYNLSYQLRPLQGALSGLMVFFLLLGGALTLNIDAGSGAMAWSTVPGVLPYIAFGVLAGYASHEFMLKLKDLAESLFALRRGDDR